MKRRHISLAITAISLAAVLVSVVTTDVSAAEIESDNLGESDALEAYPTLPVLMVVLQQQFVLDPTGLVYPTHPCPYYIGDQETSSQGELINDGAAHLLD